MSGRWSARKRKRQHGLSEWQNSGTLLTEKQVTKIRTLLTDLNEPAQQLLLASEQFNRAEQRKKWLLHASLVAFVALSIGFGIFSYFKSVEAEQNAQEAENQAKIAEKNANNAKNQAKIAKQQAQIAQLHQLSSQALLATQVPSSMNGYYDRALLLSAQAFKQQDNLETKDTLLRVRKTRRSGCDA